MLGALLDLILPPRCGGCSAPGALVCTACAGLLRAAPRRRLPVPTPPGMPQAWSAGLYEGELRRMILAYKERGLTALAAPLGLCLAQVVAVALGGAGAVRLVPVPSARSSTRRRGYDPVARLAAHAARGLRRQGRPAVVSPVLAHRRRVADQAGLSAAGRAGNLSGAFRVAPGELSGAVVVVDDVVTTGATLTEAAVALERAGAHVRIAVTLAATRRTWVKPQM
ncbi:ComF family protein [Rhizohabitans arisaemae]|uniref:ComF family protein n=1 Tax=Rhizohabitans arisaemae TaxID=2720610 RepID=UPI0024B133F9|nr:phosphoribosyltransferase family protein [Rhizohabitans arisaemae]